MYCSIPVRVPRLLRSVVHFYKQPYAIIFRSWGTVAGGNVNGGRTPIAKTVGFRCHRNSFFDQTAQLDLISDEAALYA